VGDVTQDYRTPVAQLVLFFRVILVWILDKEGEDVDEKFIRDSVDGVFLGFKRSEMRLDHADFRLGVVKEGEKMSFVALSGLEPPTEGVEFAVDVLASGHWGWR
jgi:hypothetical protein